MDSQILTRLGISPSQISYYWEPSDDLLSVLVSGFFIRGWVWKPDCNWRMQPSEALWQAVGWWMEWHPGERMSTLAVDVLSWGICLTAELLKISVSSNLHCRPLLTFEADDDSASRWLQKKPPKTNISVICQPKHGHKILVLTVLKKVFFFVF